METGAEGWMTADGEPGKAPSRPAAGRVRSERRFPRWGLWLRIGLGLTILGFLLAYVDLRETVRAIANARIELLLLALAVMFSSRLVAALRWHLLLRGRHADVSLFGTIRLMFVTSFAGYFTPGSLGVEVLRVYGLARKTTDAALSATSVLVERLLGMLALVLLVLAGAAARPPGLPTEIDRVAWLFLALLLLGVVALMARGPRALALRLLPGKRLGRVRRGLQRVFESFDTYRSQPWLLAGSLLLALIFQLMRCTTVTISAAALGHPLSFAFIIVVYPVILLISLLPISIAGIGVREASFVYFLTFEGMPAEIALSLALVQRLLIIMGTLPGGWWYVRRGLHG